MILPRTLLKLGFFLLYNHLAFTYDLVAWLVSLGHWSAWRRTVIPFLEPGLTLELAYGTGGLFKDMRQANIKAVGLDISPFMARLAAIRLRKHNLTAPLTQAQAQHLPFPAQKFTNIVATFPTPYIFAPETLAEAHRVLVNPPHGRAKLIIVMQGQVQAPAWVETLIDWLYQITGQQATPSVDALAPFTQTGFTAQWMQVPVPNGGGVASLIIAEKLETTQTSG